MRGDVGENGVPAVILNVMDGPLESGRDDIVEEQLKQ